MLRRLLVVGLIGTTFGSGPQAAVAPQMIGVWRIDQALSAAGKDITEPGVSIYIFTSSHFSMSWAGADRPVFLTPTDAQKVAMWRDFAAQAGTYDRSGNDLILHTQIAKTPSDMRAAAIQRYSVTTDGEHLWLQLIANEEGPIHGQERVRLVRIE